LVGKSWYGETRGGGRGRTGESHRVGGKGGVVDER